MRPRVLVARQDNIGDVLLAGPAIRAVAAAGASVTLLCGPRGRPAAELLPGVAEILVWRADWIDPEPEPIARSHLELLLDSVAARGFAEALILTSFHQSPLPLALLLRMAGVPRLAAISEDYPGSLLDLRHDVDDDLHEVERGLSLAEACGYPLALDDDARLQVRRTAALDERAAALAPYVVVHPGASAPARAWSFTRHAQLVRRLTSAGRNVVVTGGKDEHELTAAVCRGAPRERVADLGGETDLGGLGEVLAGAEAAVVANTGPAHLAAAVGTPVVSVYAPTVPASRWRPWGVPFALLHHAVPCAGCHARECPVDGHPCVERVTAAAVGEALAGLIDREPILRLVPAERDGDGEAPARRRAGRDGLANGDAACREGAGRMRILLWHVHGSWTTSFVQGEHEYFVPALAGRGPDGRGRARTWRWPATVQEVAPEQLRELELDVVMLQRPRELELAEQWLGRRPGQELPAVYIEHNAPQGRIGEMRHPAADRPELTLVHVTHFNQLFWEAGSTPTRVIEHGIVDPGYRYTGELPRAAAVINEARRRARVTGTDLLEQLGARTPIDLFGMDAAALGGIDDVPQDELHTQMARRRVYLHPIRWTSLGLSLIEAMHLGMPVVALATTEAPEAVPPDAGVISTRVEVLAEAIRDYVRDPDRASSAGRVARAAARRRYGLERFLGEWDALLGEVAA